MPLRASRSGVAWRSGASCSSTAPEVGRNAPASRLISVDLPAPLVPIRACTSPRCKSSDTSLTATSPPKRRVRRRAQSTPSAMCAPPAPALPSLADVSEAARQQRDGDDNESTHQQRPVLGEGGEIVLQQHERERAQYRAQEISHAPENDHQQHVARLVPGKYLRVDHTKLDRREIARHTSQRAGAR